MPILDFETAKDGEPGQSKSAGAILKALGPKMAQDRYKMALDGPKMVPRWAKMLPNGPRCSHNGPKKRQNRPNMPQDGSRMVPDASKFAFSFRMGGSLKLEDPERAYMALEDLIRPLKWLIRSYRCLVMPLGPYKSLIRLL